MNCFSNANSSKQSKMGLLKTAARTLTMACSGAALAAMIGCSGLGSAGTVLSPPVNKSGQQISGRVHGGQQAISGATIQLYAVGTTGTGSASMALLTPATTTDPNGNFSLTGKYYCPQYGSLVYVVATQGNPGLGPGKSNPNAALMAAVGPCTTPVVNGGITQYTLDPNSFIFINEITTVAAVYALAPFMTDYAHIGSSSTSTGPTGIVNAFTTAAMLADSSAGATPGPQLPYTVTPAPNTGFPTVITTLANILSGCINSDGTAAGCTQLFNYTGGTADTIAAILAITRNPGNNVANLFNLTSGFQAFAGSLSTTPNDWTISLQYVSLGLGTPMSLATDSTGNLWIANQTQNVITEVYSASSGNPAGDPNSYSPGVIGAQALAIDPSNDIWIANTAGNSVIEMDDYGNVLSSGSGYTSGINAPIAIAIDTNGNPWVANYNGNSVTQLIPSGGTPAYTASAFSPITVGYNVYAISQPTGIAVDGNNNVWLSNSGLQAGFGLATQLLGFDQNGNPLNLTSQTIQNPLGLAVDSSNNVWIASNGTSQVGAVTPAVPGPGYTLSETASGGGINQPAAVAVDSAGTIWATNSVVSGSLSEISSSGTAVSPATGFGTLNTPLGIAVDPSGNVWTANSGDNTVTEFVGIASPTTSPVVNKVAGLARPGPRGR
jgi:hypothetical protein